MLPTGMAPRQPDLSATDEEAPNRHMTRCSYKSAADGRCDCLQADAIRPHRPGRLSSRNCFTPASVQAGPTPRASGRSVCTPAHASSARDQSLVEVWNRVLTTVGHPSEGLADGVDKPVTGQRDQGPCRGDRMVVGNGHPRAVRLADDDLTDVAPELKEGLRDARGISSRRGTA
jgi:hypothetical protein